MLVKRYRSLKSVSRLDDLSIKQLFIIDSTTIGLFSVVGKCGGQNPSSDRRKKGRLKIYMLIDAIQSIGKFMFTTEAKNQ